MRLWNRGEEGEGVRLKGRSVEAIWKRMFEGLMKTGIWGKNIHHWYFHYKSSIFCRITIFSE